MRTAAGLALLSLITQIEAAGHTRVLMLDDCPDGLKGFYTPTHNRIGLCRQGHSSDGELISTLLHETTHRLQHCRKPELTAQLDMQHSVSSLETEARAIEGWWCGSHICSDQPMSSAQQAVNAALGSSALVIGRPITS